MKTRFLRKLKWLTVLACAPWLTACYDENATNAVPVTTAPATAAGSAVEGVATQAATRPGVAADQPSAKADPVVVKVFDPSTLNLSPGLPEIVKLAQSGVSEDVMKEFVKNSPYEYKLTADEIVYLNDLGISSDVVTAMMRKELPAGQAPPAPVAEPPATMTETAVAPLAPAQTAVAPAVEQPAPVDPNQAAQVQQPPPTVAPNTVVTQPVYVYEQQPAQQTTVTYQYFYDSLSPYGSWYYVADYGYCWQPTVAVVTPHWRPYMHGGRWLASDCGWYWNSSYTWGWAPFHYGRWYLHGSHGWLWVPGYTWGPSWVTWRYSPTYCGWAPLPPAAHYVSGFGFTYYGSSVDISFGFGLGYHHYGFVPYRHLYHHHPHAYASAGPQAKNIYNETTVVNNYITGNNNTIINNGVGRDVVARYHKGEVPTVAVRELPSSGPSNVRPDTIQQVGGKQVVYREPRLQTALPSASKPITAPAPAVSVLAKNRATPLSAQSAVAGSEPSSGLTSSPSGASRFGNLTPQKPVATTSPGASAGPASTGSQRTTPAGSPISKAVTAPTAPGTSPQVVSPANTARSGSVQPAKSRQNTPPVATSPTAGLTPNSATVAPSAPAKIVAPRTVTPTTRTPATPSLTKPSWVPPTTTDRTPTTGPARSATPVTPARGFESPRTVVPSTPASPNNLFNRPTTPAKGFETPRTTPPTSSFVPSRTEPYVNRRLNIAPTPRTVTPSPSVPSTPSRSIAPRTPTTPSYTPPAPSYTPPARSYTPPPARGFTPSTPSAPSYTPPARSYTPPPARGFTPAPAPSTPAPTRSYSPPAARGFSTPSAPPSRPSIPNPKGLPR